MAVQVSVPDRIQADDDGRGEADKTYRPGDGHCGSGEHDGRQHDPDPRGLDVEAQ